MPILSWGYGITAAYLLFWLVCVIHCYRKKEMYRILGLPAKAVKGLWFLFFLTFSPFALIAYFFLGILFKHKEYRSIFTHAFCLLIFAFAVVLSLPNFMSYDPQPVNIVRTPTGWQEKQIEKKEKTFSDLLDLKLHAGFIISRSNSSSTSAIHSGSPAVLPFKTIAVQLDTNNPLLYESALLLIERLKNLSYVVTIDLYPDGAVPEPGQRLPDAWIRLEVLKQSEWMIPPMLRIHSNIALTMTAEPYTSMHGYHETFSLPRIGYNLSCDITHRSTATSIGTGSAKYELTAKEIGKELFGQVKSFLDKNLPKYGNIPSELERLLPKDRELSNPPLEIMRTIKSRIEGYQPMAKSLAYWVIPLENDIHDEFDNLVKEMEDTDWRVQDRYDRESKQERPYLRFAKDNERLVIFTPRSRPGSFGETPDKYIIQHVQRMDPERIKEKIRPMIQKGCSADFLMMMNQWVWDDNELRGVYLDALESLHDLRPEILMQKATLYASFKQFDKQWFALHEALAADQIAGGVDSKKSEIDRKIKTFKNKHPEYETEISWPQIFESLGAEKLNLDEVTTIEKEVKLNQPIAFYYENDEGTLKTASAFMLKNGFKENPAPYALRLRCRSKSGGGTSTAGGHLESGHYKWNCNMNSDGLTYNASSQMIDDETFTLTLEISPEN